MISTPAQDPEIVVQEWHHRLKTNGPFHPAPTIAQAQQPGMARSSSHAPIAIAPRTSPSTQSDAHRQRPSQIYAGANLHPLRRKGPPTVTIRRVALFADLFPDFVTISPAVDEFVVPLTEVTIDPPNPEE